VHREVLRVAGLLLAVEVDLVGPGGTVEGRTPSGVGRVLRILDGCVPEGFGCRCISVSHAGLPSRPTRLMLAITRTAAPVLPSPQLWAIA
jgi:hypothetical protein